MYYILMFGLCLITIVFFQSLHIFKVTVAYFLRTETFHGFFKVAKTATTCAQASSLTIFNLRVLMRLI